VGLGDLLDDVETEPGAVAVGREAGLEDLLAVVRWDAGASSST